MQTQTRSSRSDIVAVFCNGKGGIGKSTAAAFMAQALKETGSVSAFDLDPRRGTLSDFKALGVEPIEAADGELANVKELDSLLDRLCEADDACVLDVGSGSYVGFLSWIKRDDVISILADAGKRVVFHVVVAGGKELVDTTLGLKNMIDNMDGAEFVVWLNPHFGELTHDGVHFLESPFFAEYRSRILKVITLPTLDQNYEKPALAGLLRGSETFAEAASSDRKRAEKARLARLWQPIKTQIEGAVSV